MQLFVQVLSTSRKAPEVVEGESLRSGDEPLRRLARGGLLGRDQGSLDWGAGVCVQCVQV